MKKFIVIIISLLLTLSLAACDFDGFGVFDFIGNIGGGGSRETTAELGSTFEFDDLEITISDDFGFMVFNERWSAFDGEYVFYIPITITNIGDRSNGLNPWGVTIFLPGGTGMSIIDQLEIGNDNILMSGNMQPNATMHGYIFVPYRGEGEYIIEFEDEENDMVKVVFEVDFDFDAIVDAHYSLGDTVVVEGIEITFGDSISWGRINRTSNANHGRTYFYIPVTMYNASSRAQNFPFGFDMFGPDGLSLDNIRHAVNGNDIRDAGNILPGAQITANLHILYTEDGEYIIQYTHWNHDDVTIRFYIEH